MATTKPIDNPICRLSDSEVAKLFEVTGGFYYLAYAKGQRHLCRETATIRSRYAGGAVPQVVFVGLNPGSCSPSDDTDRIPCLTAQNLAAGLYKPAALAAEADPTMCQIMRVMLATGLQSALMVNASDLKARDANELLPLAIHIDSQLSMPGIHSLFHSGRKASASRLIPLSGMRVVCCWGIDKALQPITLLADEYLSGLLNPLPAGITQAGPPSTYTPGAAFRHLCPRVSTQRSEMVCRIARQLAGRAPRACIGCTAPLC